MSLLKICTQKKNIPPRINKSILPSIHPVKYLKEQLQLTSFPIPASLLLQQLLISLAIRYSARYFHIPDKKL